MPLCLLFSFIKKYKIMIKVRKIVTNEELKELRKDSNVEIKINETSTEKLKKPDCVSVILLISTGDDAKETAKEMYSEVVDAKTFTKDQRKLLKKASVNLRSQKYIKAKQLNDLINIFEGFVPGMSVNYLDAFKKYIKKA